MHTPTVNRRGFSPHSLSTSYASQIGFYSITDTLCECIKLRISYSLKFLNAISMQMSADISFLVKNWYYAINFIIYLMKNQCTKQIFFIIKQLFWYDFSIPFSLFMVAHILIRQVKAYFAIIALKTLYIVYRYFD